MHNCVIGLDNAAREAWYRSSVRSAASAIRHDLPTAVTYCRSQLYDSANEAFSDLAFSNNGVLLALGTFSGIVRFIGLQTLCCYHSIDTRKGSEVEIPDLKKDDKKMEVDSLGHGEENGDGIPCPKGSWGQDSMNFQELGEQQQSIKECSPLKTRLSLRNRSVAPSGNQVCINHLEFFDFDRKLSFVSSIYFVIYELIPYIKEIIRIDLISLFDSLSSNLSFSEKTLFAPSVPNRLSSQFSPPNQTDTSSISPPTANPRKSPFPSKFTFPHSIISFCKILRLNYSKNDSQPSYLDFMISYFVSPPVPPIRILWDIQKSSVISVTSILTQSQLVDKLSIHSSIKDSLFPTVVFTRRYQSWIFTIDDSTGFIGNSLNNDDLKKSIQNHNSNIQLGENETNFSIWGVHRNQTRVLCAIGVIRGVVLLELFFELEFQTQVLSYIEFGSSLSSSSGLIVNRKGTLLLSRSHDRIALIRIEEFDTDEEMINQYFLSNDKTMIHINNTSSNSESSTIGTSIRSSKFQLKLQFSYSDAVQRERFDCATFCDCPSNDEMFIICSIGAAPFLHFFETVGSSGVQALVLKVDLVKSGGLKQIVWRPGTSMWAGRSTKEGSVLLFTPPPTKNIWAVMAPDFEHLEKNREIVETEEEFDDLIFLDRQKQLKKTIEDDQTGPKNPKTRSSFKNEFDINMWYTSVVKETTFEPYQFLSPVTYDAEREGKPEVEPNPDSPNVREESSVNDTEINIYELLLKSRFEKWKAKSTAKADLQRKPKKLGNEFLWLSDDEVIKSRYHSFIQR